MCRIKGSDVHESVETNTGWRVMLVRLRRSGAWKVYLQKSGFNIPLREFETENSARRAFQKLLVVFSTKQVIAIDGQKGNLQLLLTKQRRRIFGFMLTWYEILGITEYGSLKRVRAYLFSRQADGEFSTMVKLSRESVK